MSSHKNRAYIFVSSTITTAIVCENTLIYLSSHDYTNDILDLVYEELTAIAIDSVGIIFDVLLSKDVLKDSCVLDKISGSRDQLYSLISATDAEKLLHVCNSAGIKDVSVISLLSVLPFMFDDPVSIVYSNSNGVYNFAFGKQQFGEISIKDSCLATATVLANRVGANRICSISDSDAFKRRSIDYPSGDDSIAVNTIMTIFECSNLVSSELVYSSADLAQMFVNRGSDNYFQDTTEINVDSKTKKDKKVVQSKEKREKMELEKNRKGKKDKKDVVEVIGERKRGSALKTVAGIIGVLLLMLSAAGFLANIYFTDLLSDTREVNYSLCRQIKMFTDEKESLLAYANSDGEHDHALDFSLSKLCTPCEDYDVFAVEYLDGNTMVALGFNSAEALDSYKKKVSKGYTVIYESVNDDVVVSESLFNDTLFVGRDFTTLFDDANDCEYKCVFVVTE